MATIVFDAYELVHGAGKSMGIYNYAACLFRALPQALGPQHRWVVACNTLNAADFRPPESTQAVAEAAHPWVQQAVLGQGMPTRWQRLWWMKYGVQRLARRYGASVYCSPKGFLPGWWGATQGLRTVVTVHDLIPMWYQEHHPGYFGHLEERVVVGGLQRTVRHADHVITHTCAARDDIAQRTGRTQGLHYVVSGFPRGTPGAAPVQGDYLFAVGSRLPHKNTETALRAYAVYRERTAHPLPMVVTGIEDPQMPGVKVLQGLSDAALHGCYAHAKAVIFLSLAEGFGYPPLETLMHGTPLICADSPIFHETTQGAAVFAPPLSPPAVADAIVRVLSDASLVQRLRLEGPRVAARYQWEATARGIAQVMESALATSGRRQAGATTQRPSPEGTRR